MKRFAGILSVSLLAACTAGSVDGGDDVGGGDDDIEDAITCMSDLAITGTMAQSVTPPVGTTGCWPVGTWTFQPSIASNDCSPAPTPAQQVFRVDRDTASPEPDFTWIFTYVTNPTDPYAKISMGSGGAGECEGTLKLFSADGLSTWNLHPMLNEDLTIIGGGTYEVHTRDQRPPPQ